MGPHYCLMRWGKYRSRDYYDATMERAHNRPPLCLAKPTHRNLVTGRAEYPYCLEVNKGTCPYFQRRMPWWRRLLP